MLFSRRAVLVIIILALLIPALIASSPEFYLPFVAKPLTFDQLYYQTRSFLNRPVQVGGTTGAHPLLNSTLWLAAQNNTKYPLRLNLSYVNFVETLLLRHAYVVFLNEYVPPAGMEPYPLLIARELVGIDSERFIPMVFDSRPGVVPAFVSTLVIVRALSVNSSTFYYLEFHSWSALASAPQ